MLTCKTCGAALDATMTACPACSAESPMGRLTGMLGLVCRACDAYNDPGARTCVACGKPLGVVFSPPPARPSPVSPPMSPPPTPPPILARPEAAGAQIFPDPAPLTSSPGLVAQAPVPRCNRCGAASGPGVYCSRCGAPLRGADVAAAAARAPVAPVAARLVVERGDAAPGTTFRVGHGDEVQAGRAQGEVLFPDDPCLAPLHATFLVRDGALVLRDEGAAGGVFVRLRGLTVPLRAGYLFAVGDRLLRFAGPLAPPPPSPGDGTRRLGAPRPEQAAVLVEEWLEGGVGGRAYLRTGPSITIGRAGCSINLGDDPYLSQAHAEIVVDGDGTAKLRDLGASNGTFIRIPPGSEHELHDGDAVRLGREVLRVEVG
ncbi:MAG TPA: FHA domain-containing protein [Anaeromyxobacteraceae bacterium]